VVFLDPARAVGMSERRKRGGHLLSKHRFMAAQMDAYLADDLWLKLARHANAMADRLSERLKAAGFAPVWPVEANEVFVMLPRLIQERLQAAGASFYSWTTKSLPAGVTLARDVGLVRLVTSFATRESEIEDFVAAMRTP
jgi:threonine aldolase